jgi:hypothetical protein
VTLGKVLYKRFIVMHCNGKLLTGHVIIEKAKYFCDEMKITDKCTLSEGSKKNQPCQNLQ